MGLGRHMQGRRRFFEEVIAVKTAKFLGPVATSHRWSEVYEGFGLFGVGPEQFFDIFAAVFFCNVLVINGR